jgi:phosphoglycolate phosphatase
MSGGPLRLVMFDCDGTLVDSQHMIHAAMVAAYARDGRVAPPVEAVRRVVGLALPEAILRLGPDIDESDAARLADFYKDAFRELRLAGEIEDPLFPGVAETLRELEAAGFLLGIATGKSRRGLIPLLEKHGIDRFFSVLKTADDGPGKPNPAILEDAMAEVGARPADTVMIGDTLFDMDLAKNAGVGAIAVSWGYHAPAELQAAGVAAMLERLADLPHILRGYWTITA